MPFRVAAVVIGGMMIYTMTIFAMELRLREVPQVAFAVAFGLVFVWMGVIGRAPRWMVGPRR